MIKGSCHCGAVHVAIARKPDYVNFCDCSLCLKTGGVWGYFERPEISVEGQTAKYRRTDYPEPAVEIHYCAVCSVTTHWLTTEHFESERVGVNMRIFDPAELAGIEARFPDGRNWSGETTPATRRAPGRLGEDVFL